MKTYAMVDNINMGTTLDTDDPSFESNGIECHEKESIKLMKVLEQCYGIKDKDGGITLLMHPGKFKQLGSTITVTLRQDGRQGKAWFLNVHANPASVFTGDNTFGDLKLKTQVQSIFYFVLDFLAKKGSAVARLKKQVQLGNINIQSVTFAQYSKPLQSEALLKQLISRWYFMYETRVHNGTSYMSLLQELGLKRSVGDQYEDSIALSIFAPGDKLGKGNKLMHLCLYNKAQEKIDNGAPLGSIEQQEDLEKRLRFDLTVSNYYLKNYWNMEGKPTLRSLYQHVKKKWPDTGWKGAVADLMKYAINRTCLTYMMSVANPFLQCHKDAVEKWEKGRPGRKWDQSLKVWAAKAGIDLDISPDAHLIMLQGQAGLLSNTKALTKKWLAGTKGTQSYLEDLSKILTKTRETKKLASAVENLALDFSRPAYVVNK